MRAANLERKQAEMEAKEEADAARRRKEENLRVCYVHVGVFALERLNPVACTIRETVRTTLDATESSCHITHAHGGAEIDNSRIVAGKQKVLEGNDGCNGREKREASTPARRGSFICA